MSPRDDTQAPPSWSTTQQWLDDLDSDTDAPPPDPDEDRDDLDSDTDALPPDPDEDRDDLYSGDGPPPEFDEYRDDYPDTYGYAEPTDLDVVAGHSIAADAGVDPFDRAYSRADDRDEDPDDDTEDLAAQQGPEHTDTEPVTLGAPGDALPDEPPAEAANRAPPRFNKSVAIGFVAATAVATIAVTATLLGMRSSPQPADETAMPTTQISIAAPPTVQPSADGQDGPIPFTATAWCPPGSTAAQTVAGHDPTQAWVCVRNGVDGQTLDIDLGRTTVVTALSITPGWVGADATGTDQWLQHRVITRVQWNLFNGNEPATVVAQNTANVRGEAVQPMPNGGVLASRITMIVQQTSRAPADTAPTTTGAPGPGPLLDDVLGAPLGPPTTPIPDPGLPPIPGLPGQQGQTDPADNTFAVSSIKVIGHPPR